MIFIQFLQGTSNDPLVLHLLYFLQGIWTFGDRDVVAVKKVVGVGEELDNQWLILIFTPS
ncbi:hypothetical protein Hdeb2414_s0008g00296571 [Helianthus debilis subsp. tardiflorus]